MTSQDDECKCSYIYVGMKRTDLRNLSPNCPLHAEEYERKADQLFGKKK